jgi:hypothetical protein
VIFHTLSIFLGLSDNPATEPPFETLSSIKGYLTLTVFQADKNTPLRNLSKLKKKILEVPLPEVGQFKAPT